MPFVAAFVKRLWRTVRDLVASRSLERAAEKSQISHSGDRFTPLVLNAPRLSHTPPENRTGTHLNRFVQILSRAIFGHRMFSKI